MAHGRSPSGVSFHRRVSLSHHTRWNSHRGSSRSSLKTSLNAASGRGFAPSVGQPQPVEEASEQQMQMPPVERIDELIGVFQNSTTREWRRLIACSRHWDVLRDGVFARIDERAKGAESDDEPGEAL
eukprot:394523_1